MPVPTWRLAAALGAVAVVALLLPIALGEAAGGGRGLVLLADGVLLAAAGVDWWRAPRPAALAVRRHVPGVVRLGARATITWEVAGARRRAHVRLADQLAPSLRADDRRAALVVPAGGRARAEVGIAPVRRGRFLLDRITVRVEGPWRLAARQDVQRLTDVLRVHPAFPSRREAELRVDRARQMESGSRTVRVRGGGTEFEALREYGPDDEFRHIDWAATARARKPIVRTYRTERNQTVLVLLDAGRTMAGRIRDPRLPADLAELPRLDHAMDATMALVTVATGLGDRAGLLAFDERVRAVVPPGGRRDQLSRVVEALHALEPRLVESDYRRAFVEALARFRRRQLLVVCTELAAEAVEETLLPALPLVARDHVVVVAAVHDPDVERWADRPPTDAGSAYLAAAAAVALEDRRRTADRLRALGAVVVDAPPGQLAGRLADAYLEVKASGRL